jgi:glycerol dehydrogenase
MGAPGPANLHFRKIAPRELISGPGAAHRSGAAIAALGARAALVTGEVGYPLVAETLHASLDAAAVSAQRLVHRGLCTRLAIDTLAARASDLEADVIVGVGGGAVIDVAKGVSTLTSRHFAALPTSPATCAATTAHTVLYAPGGAWAGSLFALHPAALVIVDTAVVGAAPARLLAAGIVDAISKWYEVRRAVGPGGQRGGLAVSAALDLSEGLRRTFAEHALTAYAQALRGEVGESRRLCAEAAIVMPGLIGGLAGDAGRLAAVHPVANALTGLPGGHRALHGEQVGFGILVQLHLEGRAAEAADLAAWLADLGQPAGLAALGCPEAAEGGPAELAIADEIAASAAVQATFPNVAAATVVAALRAADRTAAAAAPS